MPVTPTIRIDEATCRDLAHSTRLEWLESNGLGSYASGTVSGIHTRRYHGIFLGALRPPVERVLLLSHLEDTLDCNGWRYHLGTNAYKSKDIHPDGYTRLKEFALEPWPTWTYALKGAHLKKEVAMFQGRQGTMVRYTYRSSDDAGVPTRAILTVRPLCAWRDYHDILPKDERREIDIRPAGNDTRAWTLVLRQPNAGGPPPPPRPTAPKSSYFQGPSMPSSPPFTATAPVAPNSALPPPPPCQLHVRCSLPLLVEHTAYWYEGFSYAIEEDERGDPNREDKHSPGRFVAELEPDSTVTIWFGLEPIDPATLNEIANRERDRRANLILPAYPDSQEAKMLARAADQFLVRRGSGLATVLAGYPWFTDWGRDTMIALPGLALATGRIDEANKILRVFAQATSQGMIPNRFPDVGETPEYNTVDATLWFFEAAQRFLEAGGDKRVFDRDLWPVFKSILDWHERGTRFGIGVDADDGLLKCGNAQTQLTWMDAKYEDTAFTPRHGKPVEINALWVNALRLASSWAQERGDSPLATKLLNMARKATASFNAKFWCAEKKYLYDVIESDGANHRDSSLRPNQILAVSLRHTPLDPSRFASVLAAIEKQLVTPFGLRSLGPKESKYAGEYIGDRPTRDAQYHNGPVWGWLIGPYVSAVLRVRGDSPATRLAMRQYLTPVLQFLVGRGMGQLAEIYDGDAPHTPRGCFAQAWSVSELIRVIVDHKLLS